MAAYMNNLIHDSAYHAVSLEKPWILAQKFNTGTTAHQPIRDHIQLNQDSWLYSST